MSTQNLNVVFIAVLFIVTKTWEQSRCLSVGEWISKLWYIKTMECYSAIKRNDLSNHEKTWRNLECVLLSEISQSKKVMYCIISTI